MGRSNTEVVMAAQGATTTTITNDEVEAELERLFGKAEETGLVIEVVGEHRSNSSPEAVQAFKVLLESLRMFDDRYAERSIDIVVDAPDSMTITKALCVLAKEEHQKRLLDVVLTTFGRRLIDPLAAMLEQGPVGTLAIRLRDLRENIFNQVYDLHLTAESQQILLDDLAKLYTDDYLAMVAEHEERVQRPRVEQLAQRTLRLIGTTFYRALKRWPEHAALIAVAVTKRMSKKVSLRESPVAIRDHITSAIEEFLWVETCSDLEGALFQLFAEHRSVLPVESLTIDRELYTRFAQACWEIVSEHS
ncbi:MAG: hypothetical protein U0165_04380 [Polyangiaceae bacterium]